MSMTSPIGHQEKPGSGRFKQEKKDYLWLKTLQQHKFSKISYKTPPLTRQQVGHANLHGSTTQFRVKFRIHLSQSASSMSANTSTSVTWAHCATRTSPRAPHDNHTSRWRNSRSSPLI